MRPRRFATLTAALCGTVILVGWVIATVAGFGLADIKNTHAPPIEDRATGMGEAGIEAVSAAAAVTAIAEAALPDASQMLAPETARVQIAAVSTPDPVHTDAKEVVSSAETLDESLPDSSADARARNATRADRDGEHA